MQPPQARLTERTSRGRVGGGQSRCGGQNRLGGESRLSGGQGLDARDLNVSVVRDAEKQQEGGEREGASYTVRASAF